MDSTQTTVEFLPRHILRDVDVSSALSLEQHEPAPSIQDSITSLMNMADKMEALLPPDVSIDMPDPKPEPSFQDRLSTVTGASLKTEPTLATSTLPMPMDNSFLRDVTDVSGPINPPVVNNLLTDLHRLQKYQPGLSAENTSPCAVRDFPGLVDSLPRVQKMRKTTRKPKTYSKPVASRFCHICSRMPRRGQGSATCKRMQEGFCRKIVCEQCLREQGWNYEDIASNPGNWSCPHCDGTCPPRSQCHIYNRINARRKRAPQKQSASVAAALASSDLLLGPYGHLFDGSQPPTTQILQPPPNFRLNLPPQYSQQ